MEEDEDEGAIIEYSSVPVVGEIVTGAKAGDSTPEPTPSNMQRVGYSCIQLENDPDFPDAAEVIHGRHCFHKYRITGGDADPDHWYRVGWWSGSSASRDGHDLDWISTGMTLFGGHAETVTWRPDQSYNPDDGDNITLELGVEEAGASASLSKTFTAYEETIVPTTYTPGTFTYEWNGMKDHETVISNQGGVEWAIDAGWRYTSEWWVDWEVCSPDWAC